MKNYDLKLAEKTWKKLNEIPNLEILNLTKEVSSIVPIFIKQGLDPTDAVHAATMKINNIKIICSYDKHFDEIKEIKRQEPR
jgi:predicted nucleic acid-binding protein